MSPTDESSWCGRLKMGRLVTIWKLTMILHFPSCNLVASLENSSRHYTTVAHRMTECNKYVSCVKLVEGPFTH